MEYPDPATMCQGQCEGTGVFPQYNREADARAAGQHGHASMAADSDMGNPTIAAAWHLTHLEAGPHECDGWHFIQCPDCGGTGKRLDVASGSAD